MSSIVQQFLERIDAAIQADSDLFLVRVHRYTHRVEDGEKIPSNKFGWHMLLPQHEGWLYQTMAPTTLGLIKEEDDHHLRLALNVKRGMDELDPAEVEMGACSRWPEGRNLREYVIHQVCPIEFHKPMDAGDPEYKDSVRVYACASTWRSGLSKSWAKKSDIEQLAKLRERVLAERPVTA